jgi:hypothetical protein
MFAVTCNPLPEILFVYDASNLLVARLMKTYLAGGRSCSDACSRKQQRNI